MDMIARRDGTGRHADDLSVADDVLARFDRLRRDFVPAGDGDGQGQALIRQGRPGRQIGQCNNDVVIGVQPDTI